MMAGTYAENAIESIKSCEANTPSTSEGFDRVKNATEVWSGPVIPHAGCQSDGSWYPLNVRDDGSVVPNWRIFVVVDCAYQLPKQLVKPWSVRFEHGVDTVGSDMNGADWAGVTLGSTTSLSVGTTKVITAVW